MAIRILCKQVNKEFQLESLENAECPWCFSEIDSNHVVQEEKKIVSGFLLQYEKTNEQFEIRDVNDVVLGREGLGKDFFDKVLYKGKPVVSRKHCRVKRVGNQLLISDENSTNGTFVGLEKRSCLREPIPLEDYGILYFGMELFKVWFIYEDSDKPDKEDKKDGVVVRYKCVRCGLIFDKYSEFCPNVACREFHGLKSLD